MFTETLAEVLDNNLSIEAETSENTLTAEDGGVKLEVKTEDNDEKVEVTITYPDGAWKAVFHTCEDSAPELAQVIADEFDYWINS